MTSPIPPLVTDGWSPKAVVASLTAFLLAVLLPAGAAVIEHLVANPAVFSAWPAPVQVGVTAALVSLGTLLAAYRARPGVVVQETARQGIWDD
jgi:hypothetical protein